MYAGRIVEQGPVADVLNNPRHPYTCGLIESVPDPQVSLRLGGLAGTSVGVGEWPTGCPFAPRCTLAGPECSESMPGVEQISAEHSVRCFHHRLTPKANRVPKRAGSHPSVADEVLSVDDLVAKHTSRNEEVVAAAGVSFSVRRAECVALVGESGSGKTTIGRCIAGLHAPSGGSIRLHGEPLASLASRRPVEARRRVQIVFQNPYDSLNPRHRIAETVMRPAIMLARLERADARTKMLAALEQVRLPLRIADRYPSELSGGERQRVAIARALVARPELLICDEITSALDVSVQGVVLDLLEELRAQLGLAILFISHDLGVVASVADRVLILNRGTICEAGAVEAVLRHPEESYTRQLLQAAPRLEVGLP
jgi:peptide/nickel transport system ATP-binding protein